jgi:hypothetical protein
VTTLPNNIKTSAKLKGDKICGLAYCKDSYRLKLFYLLKMHAYLSTAYTHKRRVLNEKRDDIKAVTINALQMR